MIKYIKTILLALVGKYAKTHEKDIKKAQKWIDSAQSQFASAMEEAELAEQKFADFEAKKRAEVEKSLEELNEISSKKETAIKFKNKVKQFIED
ncbi:hypothetical protein [Peribacillus asahii]|uniref:hypothetical protein n=1 Tax=Peribacillus asahii TaxID=228899 RepID=UPI003820D116